MHDKVVDESMFQVVSPWIEERSRTLGEHFTINNRTECVCPKSLHHRFFIFKLPERWDPARKHRCPNPLDNNALIGNPVPIEGNERKLVRLDTKPNGRTS